jgi:hypothetical protein
MCYFRVFFMLLMSTRSFSLPHAAHRYRAHATRIQCGTGDALSKRLWSAGYAVDALHGDKEQRERTAVMTAFKAGKIKMVSDISLQVYLCLYTCACACACVCAFAVTICGLLLFS